jgi:hypothetical protein
MSYLLLHPEWPKEPPYPQTKKGREKATPWLCTRRTRYRNPSLIWFAPG